MADAGGVVGLSQLATMAQMPLPTIHRIVRTLVDLGYVRQEANREYSLGPKLIRLGDVTSQMVGRWARPQLEEVVRRLGESANVAQLDGDRVVYIGQVMPSHNSMRMFTEVGRAVLPHATGVGKAIMATMTADEVDALLDRTGMPSRTEHTITDRDAFHAELDATRERGYALDEQEQELGVRCVAVSVPAPGRRLALSVSGPLTRMTDAVVSEALAPLHEAAERIAHQL
ncbi:IclR family transcriptional regulator [Calidifontibacter sp. DB0510]|uniref:IclR family transcriptional regulator n=2 Tax=Metallococcus carri TaxID=1656884 RepID=A0A967EB90_9MICO|nr:IclR family transcriptional regulator [Metallococcus carri]NOP39071.1 IclR family transcriptional regulator [Calidifontibacter sp. DB2511S]